MKHPEPLRRLIDAFLILPGIGRKTAERFAFSLMENKKESLLELSSAINDLQNKLKKCDLCRQFSENSPCEICRDSNRDREILCVVAHNNEAIPIEQTGRYKGLYFILGNELNPIDGVTPNDLNIEALIKRITNDGIKEVILAFNVDTNGEATTNYVHQSLSKLPIKITRPARGLSSGLQLEYADEATLANALANRSEI